MIDLLSPLEPQSPDDKALIYLLGTALIRDEQTARGQVLVDRILRDGDSAEARLLMGATKMSVHDFAGALADLKKAVELNPQLPDVYSYYGMALASTGDTPGAGGGVPQRTGIEPERLHCQHAAWSPAETGPKLCRGAAMFPASAAVRPGDASVRYQLAALDLQEGRTKRRSSNWRN